MKQFPKGIAFKYDWRKYQKRVLDELEQYIDDDHLHIIAPPGSGKTVLGLEVALRLNKPTLIFAPTIAISNQWIQRFCELFLRVKLKPDWISKDIYEPRFLTVVTYQGLHAACSGSDIDEESEEESINEKKVEGKISAGTEEIIRLLKAQNIGTVVVDEAHHLKNAWWESLTKVKKALNPTIVGLTATPPYDVSHAEWQRYSELNGPVDAEISVPELVVEGDLCPHQDYVFFSSPTVEESQKISDYSQRAKTVFREIKGDPELIQALEKHPCFQNPNEQLDWIYNNLEYYSSTLIFLNSVGKTVTDDHLEIIGDKKFQIPELDYVWMEILLTFYLYKDPDNFSIHEEHQQRLINKLKRNGVLDRRAVNFRHHRRINSILGSSISKLRSIEQLVDFEYCHLKHDLRMVILTDYIRKEFLINQPTNNLTLNKIGVMPIFEQLRRANKKSIKIGVLTGSLVIIPVSASDAFKAMVTTHQIGQSSISPLAFDDRYLVVSASGKLKHEIVHIITQIFQQGYIEVLVGTKSLLGEGWDAPSINALVLASFIGSYVQSNQMRGRAIRTERQNVDKTGNIWHLVCVDPTAEDGGDDVQLLKRRFKAFVGVSFREELTIENGIGRLDLPSRITSEQEIASLNDRILLSAGQRDELKEKWRQALASGVTLIEELKVPFSKENSYRDVKSLYYNRTLKYLMGTLVSGLIGFGFEAFQVLNRLSRYIRTEEDLTNFVMIAGGLGVLIFGRQGFKTFRAYVKYRDISEDFHQIGEALLQSLIKIGAIHTPSSKLTVVSDIDDYGAIYCHLEGGTTYEKSTFIKSLQDIVGNVDSPRYVVIRKSFFLDVLSQKDYHSVPEIIGRKKQFAEYFERQWRIYVGRCTLIYTRTIEGRKLLLKSRIHSLASEFEEPSERINKWR